MSAPARRAPGPSPSSPPTELPLTLGPVAPRVAGDTPTAHRGRHYSYHGPLLVCPQKSRSPPPCAVVRLCVAASPAPWPPRGAHDLLGEKPGGNSTFQNPSMLPNGSTHELCFFFPSASSCERSRKPSISRRASDVRGKTGTRDALTQRYLSQKIFLTSAHSGLLPLHAALPSGHWSLGHTPGRDLLNLTATTVMILIRGLRCPALLHFRDWQPPYPSNTVR
ncbi:hypothetical protein BS50DRAFT_161243 [Corynespora cassiicola Philippines]|uniref:Uncharacterized protein n=1 Tax=Corynespora cassiicola Philippines TaxID=1448308 RepID=A0A2T2N679_CORCC|nr:hypothetical protein BS50DRAFT_161243 [Corynespora cassiicola Philippines]